MGIFFSGLRLTAHVGHALKLTDEGASSAGEGSGHGSGHGVRAHSARLGKWGGKWGCHPPGEGSLRKGRLH